jgi:hypothetical protein
MTRPLLPALARTALVVALFASAALRAFFAPDAAVDDAAGHDVLDVNVAIDAVGTDGDGCPPGLSADEEIAWAFAHLAPVVVTPVAGHAGDLP